MPRKETVADLKERIRELEKIIAQAGLDGSPIAPMNIPVTTGRDLVSGDLPGNVPVTVRELAGSLFIGERPYGIVFLNRPFYSPHAKRWFQSVEGYWDWHYGRFRVFLEDSGNQPAVLEFPTETVAGVVANKPPDGTPGEQGEMVYVPLEG